MYVCTYVCAYIYIYIYIYIYNAHIRAYTHTYIHIPAARKDMGMSEIMIKDYLAKKDGRASQARDKHVRPVRLLRVWVSKGLTQADS